ncbi:inositol monophosphatase 1-like [Metopolophium dirhodum]|uniref:inositol monophosphatase 1-like n=1 Tax=Metopolophium dirhodum TaxID=44670 RepID=UPI00298F7738|nr:inositol monophosphatase 1-like [Metopolophium dirhodum]
MVDMHQYYSQALKIVLEAGELLLKGFKSPKEISTKKNDKDFVTQYDKLIEKTIIDNILQLYPNHKFIAEESAESNILTEEPTWILDPIDGTTNFIQGFPFCCISLALVIENDIIIGIVYNPIINQLFTAQKGEGAYLNNEKIQVSSTEDLQNAMFGHDINHKISVRNFRGSRSLGSAAMSLCYLAMGAVDICSFERLKCWDVAAGILIIQEARGIVLDSKGSQYKDIMNADILAVCTKKLAENFLKLKNVNI